MTAWYNEPDPYAAQWLRNLIDAGHIAPGVVDERPIQEVDAAELARFTQCHFFAGIGIWSRALRDAGWPDDRPIWTGSCPCQPFSNAGQQKGFKDERHLWPYWSWLIAQRRPPVVIGEQVASALAWLDLVSADLEGAGYAFGASDLCAAGFSGAHIRQRLYFVGREHSDDGRKGAQPGDYSEAGEVQAGELRSDDGSAVSLRAGGSSRLAHPERAEKSRQQLISRQGLSEQEATGFAGGRMVDGLELPETGAGVLRGAATGRLADTAECARQPGEPRSVEWQLSESDAEGAAGTADAPMLGRNPVDWLYCRDGKWRPVEPGTFPLVDAAPSRVGRLRAYGNGLDLETATQFVGAVMDALGSS